MTDLGLKQISTNPATGPHSDFSTTPSTLCPSTLSLTMQSRRIHDTHILGSDPPPTFACPHCPRYFQSKSGRTKHIQAKHVGSRPQSPNLPPSPVPLSYSSSHGFRSEDPESAPARSTPPPPSESEGGFGAADPDASIGFEASGADSEHPSLGRSDFGLDPDVSMDLDFNSEHPWQFSQGYVSPARSHCRDLDEDEDENLPLGSDASEQHVPDAPLVTRVCHPKLDGTLHSFDNYSIDTDDKL